MQRVVLEIPRLGTGLIYIQDICYTRLLNILNNNNEDSTVLKEAAAYLCNSFGNWQRIDYGTGHELHFLLFLYCLHQLNPTVDPVYHSLYLFPMYIELMRSLESTYWLEPAGSHGVWGLDDYHFLPFLFGSAQLCTHPHLRPSSIHNPDLIIELSNDYLYFDAIRVINSLKLGVTLRWHSPMLDDISAVKTWQKVNEGMLRMYQVEVLGKQPIMQHLLFGSVLVFKDSDKPQEAEATVRRRYSSC